MSVPGFGVGGGAVKAGRGLPVGREGVRPVGFAGAAAGSGAALVATGAAGAAAGAVAGAAGSGAGAGAAAGAAWVGAGSEGAAAAAGSVPPPSNFATTPTPMPATTSAINAATTMVPVRALSGRGVGV
jgi:hypothetical protein